jgi:hypothetical protein
LEQLNLFLLGRGPMWRKDIISESGMPKGTIAAILTKEKFSKDGDGRWCAAEDDELHEAKTSI